jgi:hypothetical protein
MISHVSLTEDSPGAPGTVVGTKVAENLDAFSAIAVYFTLRGATGGALNVTLQVSYDGDKWYDWYRSSDIAAAAAATTFKVTDSHGDASTTLVGMGTTAPSAATPVLEKGTVAPGLWGKKMRAVFEAAGGTTQGASQEIIVVGHRPSG